MRKHQTDPSHTTAEKAYYLLYNNAPNTLSRVEVAKACDDLLSTTELSSILFEASMGLRAERILSHPNIPQRIFETLIDVVDLQELISPYGGVALKLLLHPCFTLDSYKKIIVRIENNYPLMEELYQSTDKALKIAGLMLTYKIVLIRRNKSRKQFHENQLQATFKEHLQHQQQYRSLFMAKNQVEKIMLTSGIRFHER